MISCLKILTHLRPLSLLLRRNYLSCEPKLQQEFWGLKFSNPVGLAAGFDKNGEVVESMESFGFGYLEIGTVTPRPQAGNPRPRVFRYPQHQSLQNFLGFNNRGVVAMAAHLQGSQARRLPLGINIGKNRDTPIERAAEDYLAALDTLADSGDYFVVNVSSPNTPALRDLQDPLALKILLRPLRECTTKPLLVKLSPDLSSEQAVTIARAALSEGADGLILTNTTTNYDLIPGAPRVGGLSGRVLAEASSLLLQVIASEFYRQCPIISVGGISSADDAVQRIRLGASLVQLYTALIFSGPALIYEINQGISVVLDRLGADSIQDLQGIDLKKLSNSSRCSP